MSLFLDSSWPSKICTWHVPAKRFAIFFLVVAALVWVGHRFKVPFTLKSPTYHFANQVVRSNISGRSVQPFVFIKTHKTGSSTLAKILLAYAWHSNLRVVTGRHGGNQLGGYPNPFRASRIFNPTNQRFDCLMYHARLSQELIDLMPTDTKFITIVRFIG